MSQHTGNLITLGLCHIDTFAPWAECLRQQAGCHSRGQRNGRGTSEGKISSLLTLLLFIYNMQKYPACRSTQAREFLLWLKGLKCD